MVLRVSLVRFCFYWQQRHRRQHSGPPAAVRLTVDRDTISTAASDLADVGFEIVDSGGVVVPAAENRVRGATPVRLPPAAEIDSATATVSGDGLRCC